MQGYSSSNFHVNFLTFSFRDSPLLHEDEPTKWKTDDKGRYVNCREKETGDLLHENIIVFRVQRREH